MTRGGRPVSLSTTATPAEAQQIYESFSGFWGSYTVDDNLSTVTYRPQADVNPGQVGRSEVVSIDPDGKRLAITIHPQATNQTVRAMWERVPDLEALSPSHRRLAGFWQWVSEERVADNGRVLNSNKRDPRVIAYTPAGYVAVHFPPATRKSFAGPLRRLRKL